MSCFRSARGRVGNLSPVRPSVSQAIVTVALSENEGLPFETWLSHVWSHCTRIFDPFVSIIRAGNRFCFVFCFFFQWDAEPDF